MALILNGDGSISGVNTISDLSGGLETAGLSTFSAGLNVTGGRVGIGTEIPGGTLEISDTSEYQLVLKDSDSSGQGAEMAIGFRDSVGTTQGILGFNDWADDEFHIINQNNGGAITLKTNNGSTGERVRITSDGKVGIESSSPRVALDVSQATDGIALPVGTQAQRPTGVEGYMRFNSESKALEIYNGTNWVEIISDYFPQGSVILG